MNDVLLIYATRPEHKMRNFHIKSGNIVKVRKSTWSKRAIYGFSTQKRS